MMVSSSKPKRPASFDTETLAEVLSSRLKGASLCLSSSWGGLEKIAANDALELGRLGLDYSLVCLRDTPVHEFLQKQKGIRVHALAFKPRDFFDFKLRTELKKMVEYQKINLVHCHQTSYLGSVIPWTFRYRNLAVLASRHIMNNHSKRNPFHAFVYGRLDGLIVMSQALKNNVLDTHALRERQVKVIHYGLNFDRFEPEKVHAEELRREWGADDRTVLVGLVGRIDPAKGQATFINAAAGLMKTPPQGRKIKFVMVGEETRGRGRGISEELEKMVNDFRLKDSVIFAGYREEIPEVMKALDVFVMPSRQEAFGLVAIEAMAMECPVIISRGGSSSEIIGEEEFGLHVRPDDAFDLQRQMRYLIENPEKRKQMGHRAREHVRAHYDRRLRVQKTLELYERTLRRRGM